jgi:hypothetical protein
VICFKISSAGRRMVRRKWLSALAIGFFSVVSTSASPIELGISGNAQVGQNFISFGQYPGGDPYSPAPEMGVFSVSMLSSGIFTDAGVQAGQTGTIRSLEVNQQAVQPFMSLQGSNAQVDMYLLQIAPGTAGPFTLWDTPNGAIVYMSFAGVVVSPGRLQNFTGTFSATFNGWTAASLLAEEAQGLSLTTPFSATFSAVPVPTPEPRSLLLLGLSLSVLGLIARGKSKASSASGTK